MIDKILDKYYAKKLYEEIQIAICPFNYVSKYQIKDNRLSIFIKKRQYKDCYYRIIYFKNISESFKDLLRVKEIIDYIEKEYLEEYKNE